MRIYPAESNVQEPVDGVSLLAEGVIHYLQQGKYEKELQKSYVSLRWNCSYALYNRRYGSNAMPLDTRAE